MNGLSNLPPGVSDADIPGNRQEDEEHDFVVTLTLGEIEDLNKFRDEEMKKPFAIRHKIWYAIDNLLDQVNDNLNMSEALDLIF